jgi:Tol biopolymer transport system component
VRGQPSWVTRGARGDVNPDSSPDGTWVAFSTWGEKEDLFIVRPDGSDLRQLTDDIFKDRFPRWSPDGKRILFYSNRSGNWDIWTVNANGGELTQITDTPDRDETQSDWSPDGTKVVFGDDGGVYTLNLTVDVEQRVPEILQKLSEAGWVGSVPAWSPDGRRVAVICNAAGSPRSEIVAYDLATKKIEILADFGKRPVWLNDSRRLLYDTGRTLLLLDTGSKMSRQVLSLDPGEGFWPSSLTADNRDIYLSVIRREADIWLMESK